MARDYLTVADVGVIHSLVLQHGGGSAGFRDRGALESAVFRPQTGYYADILEETAALMESLTNNHPFVDGNKRTAVLAAEVFLDYNGYTLDVDPWAAYSFVMKNLKRGSFKFKVIHEWLERVVRPQ